MWHAWTALPEVLAQHAGSPPGATPRRKKTEPARPKAVTMILRRIPVRRSIPMKGMNQKKGDKKKPLKTAKEKKAEKVAKKAAKS